MYYLFMFTEKLVRSTGIIQCAKSGMGEAGMRDCVRSWYALHPLYELYSSVRLTRKRACVKHTMRCVLK